MVVDGTDIKMGADIANAEHLPSTGKDFGACASTGFCFDTAGTFGVTHATDGHGLHVGALFKLSDPGQPHVKVADAPAHVDPTADLERNLTGQNLGA